VSLIEPEFHHTWYVGFSVAQFAPRWMLLGCKKEWSHCFCFADVGPYTQLVDPTLSRCRIELLDRPAERVARELSDAGCTILKVTLAPQQLKFRSVWLCCCVSVVKRILGYNTGWLCYNPERFAKHLVKNGAEVVVF